MEAAAIELWLCHDRHAINIPAVSMESLLLQGVTIN